VKPVQRRIITAHSSRTRKANIGLRLTLAGATLLALFAALLLGIVASAMGAGAVGVNTYYQQLVPQHIDTIVALENQKVGQTIFLDRTGQHKLAVLYDSNRGVSKPVKLNQISQWLQLATIDIEDASFYDNPGFDPRGISRALYEDLLHRGAVQGGSSITQQLVKNSVLSSDSNYQRKFNELLIAWGLTQKYSGHDGKKKILEMYLNSIAYGNQCKGIEAAAQFYFHRAAATLDLAQASMLAGIPNGPSLYEPVYHRDAALQRQKLVLDRMVHQRHITADQEQQAIDESQRFAAFPPRTFRHDWYEAPHWVDYVKTNLINDLPGHEDQLYSGLTVTTTLNYNQFVTATNLVRQQTDQLTAYGHNAHDGAVVAINPRTREILCMVGSANWADASRAGAGQYNMAIHPRQPGSSFKPFTYVTAFEQGAFPAQVVMDKHVVYPDGATPYAPDNYDKKYHGGVTLRFALANSLNIPAVELLNKVGVNALLKTVADFGMPGLLDEQRLHHRFGLSLVLGSAEVPLLDMTNGYGVFADGGVYAKPKYVLKITDANGQPVTLLHQEQLRRVVAAQYAYQITSILSDNYARAYEFGTQTAAASPLVLQDRPAAVKTGTTNSFKDNLTIGYTPSLVTGVWVGNADNTDMNNVIGIDGAGPIWQTFMTSALASTPVEGFQAPPGMITTTVSGRNGLLATNYTSWRIRDVFAPGQVPHYFDNGYSDGTLYNIMGEMSLHGSLVPTYDELAGQAPASTTPVTSGGQPNGQPGAAPQPGQAAPGATFHSATNQGNLCNGRLYHWTYDANGGYTITCQ